MTSLHIDIETYCKVDLKKSGAYRYAEEAEIILFAYAYDNEPVHVVDLLSGEEIPYHVMNSLTNPLVTKKAFNAAFERAVMQAYFNMKLPADQWECTQARTAMCGLPLNLGQAAQVLNIPQQKDAGGTALIRFFCVPIKKPIKKNDFCTRNLPVHDLAKWNQFKSYNGKDVDAERAVCRALAFYNISDFENRQWQLDQRINERGVAINVPFVRSAIFLINHYENGLLKEFTDITGIDKPTKLAQLKKWLFDETGEEVEKINKETIPDIIKNTDSQRVLRAMEIRKDSSKTSTKKYPTMMAALCRDGRVRGLHEYYGANRTGRAAGRLLQHQNLPRGNYKNIEPVRDLVMKNDPEWLEFTYGAIPDALSSLIRSAIVPAPGHRFIISDFSAVEARGIAWLAGEDWVLDVFKTHGKIYEATAAKMFNIPIESIGKSSPYRQKGKVAALALGYQGAVGALVKMGALREGLTEEELPAIVRGWRLANLNIVAFWTALDRAAKEAIQTGHRIKLSDIYVDSIYVGQRIDVDYWAPDKGIEFYMRGRSLFLRLPSGRELVYASVGIEVGEFGDKITYWGVDQTKKKWTKLDTYGGKLAENCLIGDSKVLSLQGWVRLSDVTKDTILWDGEDWVVSSGIICKGFQNTISINGVYMTPNHKILTEYGWKEASSVEGFNRKKVQLPDSFKLRRFQRKEITLDSTMQVRYEKGNGWKRVKKTKNKILRMYAQGIDRRRYSNSRTNPTSSLRSMEINAGSMSSTYPPSVAQLRRSGNTGVQKMGKIHSFLERHESFLSKEFNTGKERCKRKLYPSKLYLGNYEVTDQKQESEPLYKYTLGEDNHRRGSRKIRNKLHNNTLPSSQRVPGEPFIIKAGVYEQVYDIVNCGPQNRFVVQDENGIPFIVHNCTQALCRDLLMNGLQNLDRAGYPIVLHVHDEAVAEMPVGQGSLEEVNELMTILPEWADGFPLDAEGDESFYYKK